MLQAPLLINGLSTRYSESSLWPLGSGHSPPLPCPLPPIRAEYTFGPPASFPLDTFGRQAPCVTLVPPPPFSGRLHRPTSNNGISFLRGHSGYHTRQTDAQFIFHLSTFPGLPLPPSVVCSYRLQFLPCSTIPHALSVSFGSRPRPSQLRERLVSCTLSGITRGLSAFRFGSAVPLFHLPTTPGFRFYQIDFVSGVALRISSRQV